LTGVRCLELSGRLSAQEVGQRIIQRGQCAPQPHHNVHRYRFTSSTKSLTGVGHQDLLPADANIRRHCASRRNEQQILRQRRRVCVAAAGKQVLGIRDPGHSAGGGPIQPDNGRSQALFDCRRQLSAAPLVTYRGVAPIHAPIVASQGNFGSISYACRCWRKGVTAYDVLKRPHAQNMISAVGNGKNRRVRISISLNGSRTPSRDLNHFPVSTKKRFAHHLPSEVLSTAATASRRAQYRAARTARRVLSHYQERRLFHAGYRSGLLETLSGLKADRAEGPEITPLFDSIRFRAGRHPRRGEGRRSSPPAHRRADSGVLGNWRSNCIIAVSSRLVHPDPHHRAV